MFNRQTSIPADEAVVAKALDSLKNRPGGILRLGPAVLDQLAQTMAWQDFAALKLDLADAQQLAKNVSTKEPLDRQVIRGPNLLRQLCAGPLGRWIRPPLH